MLSIICDFVVEVSYAVIIIKNLGGGRGERGQQETEKYNIYFRFGMSVNSKVVCV